MENIGAILAGLALLVALAVALLVVRRQSATKSTLDATLEARLRELSAAQSEIAGRFGHAIEVQARQQSDLTRAVTERLEALDTRLGVNLKNSATQTAETLGNLQARLKIIDEAQKNLTDLSGHVVGLQQVLSNKQARGAYGQGNMETIIRDALPPTLYEFQATLSNRSRPDCLIHLPNSTASIVIDSKFPLECFELYRRASTDGEKRLAAARVKADVQKHVRDIAEKYLISGETQDPALMFVPSESVFAELHESFSDLIASAGRARVVVVSPSILMLAISTVQTVLKDAAMREQASLIQREVGDMMKDVKRLVERVSNLQRHMTQANTDLSDIATSTDKILRRAEKIEQVELPVPEVAGRVESAK